MSHWDGRNSQNKMVIFPKLPGTTAGDYVLVRIHDATSATLLGTQQS
ncbi:MAG: TRAM domain-containing protein [Lewinella sp.]